MRNRWLANKKAANLLKDVDRVVGLMPLPTVWDEVPKKCRLLDSWKTLQTTLQVRKDLVRRWQDAYFTGVTKGMANIVCQLDRVRSLGLSLAAVKSDFRKIREAIATVDRLSFEENRIDQSAREVRAEMDQMVVQGERCPTCNQELRELP